MLPIRVLFPNLENCTEYIVAYSVDRRSEVGILNALTNEEGAKKDNQKGGKGGQRQDFGRKGAARVKLDADSKGKVQVDRS
jgi:hypothetical protein